MGSNFRVCSTIPPPFESIWTIDRQKVWVTKDLKGTQSIIGFLPKHGNITSSILYSEQRDPAHTTQNFITDLLTSLWLCSYCFLLNRVRDDWQNAGIRFFFRHIFPHISLRSNNTRLVLSPSSEPPSKSVRIDKSALLGRKSILWRRQRLTE